MNEKYLTMLQEAIALADKLGAVDHVVELRELLDDAKTEFKARQ